MWEVISENDRGRGGSRQDTENKTFEIWKKMGRRQETKVYKMRQRRINENKWKIPLKAEWKQKRNKRKPLANTSSAHCL